MHPVKIEVQQNKDISIRWTDGSNSRIDLRKLRQLCPCATCQTFRDRQGTKYIPIYNDSQVNVLSIEQIGSYAIQIKWKDGHNTGIFEYQFLLTLGSLV